MYHGRNQHEDYFDYLRTIVPATIELDGSAYLEELFNRYHSDFLLTVFLKFGDYNRLILWRG